MAQHVIATRIAAAECARTRCSCVTMISDAELWMCVAWHAFIGAASFPTAANMP